MKKVIAMCMAIGFIATACDWTNPHDEETPEIVETFETSIDSNITTKDSTSIVPHNDVAASEKAEN